MSSIPPAERAAPWRANLALFVATVASVFFTAVVTSGSASDAVAAAEKAGAGDLVAMLHAFGVRQALVDGAEFSVALLGILVAHELGHYVAARIHKVDASLPYFIPVPYLSPFGTMGAVIRMRGTIPTRAALLDIGASGPLAGMALAIPLYFWGCVHSHWVPVSELASGGSLELGESLALKLLERLAVGPARDGMELVLSPVAYAAWGGMFVTMINLLPVAQLDGGHVAYALFGTRQDKLAPIIHRAMLGFFFVLVIVSLAGDIQRGWGLYRVGKHVGNSIFWLVWFEVLAVLGALARVRRDDHPDPAALSVRARAFATVGLLVVAGVGRDHPSPPLWLAWFAGLALLLAMERRGGALRPTSLLDHPPTGAAPLGKGRAAIAIFTLILFALLFMPQPISM